MTVLLTNNAVGYLASGISSSALSLTLTANGSLFPSPGAGEYFYATLTDPSGTMEIVKVTARSTNTFTIVRAQEGTTAAAFLAGSAVELRVTVQSVRDAISDSTFDPAPYFTADGSGTAVGINIGTGKTLNAASGTVLLPVATVPAQTAEGSIVWDTNDDLLTVGTGAARKIMVDTNSTQTLTGKTLTSPTLTTPTLTSPSMSTIVNTGTLTLPTATDTLVGRATGDTLTNKVISGATNTLTVRLNQNDVTGVLPVSKGGTGGSTLTANGVLIANGTSPISTVAPGAADNILISDGTSWTSAARAVPVVTGNAGKVLRTDGTTASWGTVINSATAAATSGSTVDFSSIPSWVRRITVVFNQISWSAGTNMHVRIGTGGTVISSGYTSNASYTTTGAAQSSTTAGFNVFFNDTAQVISGIMTIVNLQGTNTWIAAHTLAATATYNYSGAGRVTLAGTMDILRVTNPTVGANFDGPSGVINIFWE